MSAYRRRSRELGFLALFALYCGCDESTPQATGIMLRIDAQSTTKRVLSAIQLRLYRKRNDTWEAVADEHISKQSIKTWPVEVPLLPEGDLTRTVEVQAVALDARGGVVTRTRALSSFVKGKQTAIPLLLEDACRASSCDESACHGEGCALCVHGVCRQAALLLPPIYSPRQSVEDAWDAFTTPLADEPSHPAPGQDGGPCTPGVFGKSRFDEACFE